MTRLALFVLLIFSAPGIVYSQQAANATLTGTVTDPHGAVVSGVTITAIQKATGVKRETVTNDAGLYVLSNLAPGDYELSVGQDLSIGYAYHLKATVELYLTESFTFRILEPAAAVALRVG